MSKRSAEKAKESQRRGSRLLEVIAVALLGIATIGTAWCGYQSSRWNGEESDLARDASNAETEGARLFGLATQTVSYDSNIIAEYASAYSAGNERLKEFYRAVLIRPGLLPTIDRWEAELAAGQVPTNLLEDEDYLEEQMAPYRASVAESEALTVEGQEAGEHADDYVLTTLLLASALFFAGITTSFRVRFAQIVLLVGASLTIAYAASRLIDLPIV